jgi:putative ABC transport system permease protein
LLDVPRARPRLNAIVLVLFAAAAVSLAAVGLFAIISTMVRQRTQELGIRMALGATSGNVRAMVMRRGIVLATAGAIIGVAGALVTGRLMSSLLFAVSSADPITLLGVATLIVGVAGIASFFPAQATTRIDPVVALHSP